MICDPHNLSQREQEQICRGWVRQMARNIGPDADVPAPDVMTSAQHMLWMLDEFEAHPRRPRSPASSPASRSASAARWAAPRPPATAWSSPSARRCKELDIRAADTTASVQGFGNVAQYAIRLYEQLGGTAICVSCWDQEDQTSYAFRKKDGIDLDELLAITDRFGGIDKAKARELGYEVLPGDAWLEQDVDILIPAALENQITAENVDEHQHAR